MDDTDDDALSLDDLRPREGGTWGATLFENQSIGMPPSLWWSFRFEFEDVTRSYGTSPVDLVVEWVPLPRCDWRHMEGLRVVGECFGEPIETTMYFFDHHMYDGVDLRIVGQDGQRIHVVGDVRGDVDGLGIESFGVDRWLTFGSIAVALDENPPSLEAATALVQELTAAGSLVGRRTARGGYRFTPRSGATGADPS